MLAGIEAAQEVNVGLLFTGVFVCTIFTIGGVSIAVLRRYLSRIQGEVADLFQIRRGRNNLLRISDRQAVALVRFICFEVGIALIPVLWAYLPSSDTLLRQARSGSSDPARHGDLFLLGAIAAFVGLASLLTDSTGSESARHSPKKTSTRLSAIGRTLASFGAIAVGMSSVHLYSASLLLSDESFGRISGWQAWMYWAAGAVAGSACIVAAEGH
jgi:hypothetical protein